MSATVSPPRRRRHIGLWVLGTVGVLVVALVALWNWDWFLPLVESRASAALGRKVTAQHLHVALGRVTTLTLDNVTVATADGFDPDKPFAHTDKLTVQADVMSYIRHREIVIPQIALDNPTVEAVQKADGSATWPSFGGGDQKAGQDAKADAGPKIGQLVINNGHAHVALAKLKADFNLDVATQGGNGDTAPPTSGQTPAQAGKASEKADSATDQADSTAPQSDNAAGKIVVDAKGTYAAQPITGRLIGGALLSLRDTAHPYPVDLHVANGPTRVAITGTVENPLNFAGANIKLQLTGPDMSLLTPLTGIPIPQTPPYNIAGNLDYADRKVRFTNFTGRLGESDLNGSIAVDPTGEKPFVDANLFSHKVQLADLGGFIGAQPGRKGESGQTPQQKAELARKEASDRALPDVPINLPKLNAANVKLRYKGEHILGRSVPLDDIVAAIDINNGNVKVDPLSFKVGTGEIKLTADLQPSGKDVKADMAVGFDKVDLGRLLSATHLVEGAGAMSGNARLVSTGDSLADLLAHGDGGFRLGMSGGNLSALLADLAGLEFGNALLSALGVPQRANLECFAAGFVLYKGVLSTRTLIVDTSEVVVQGQGGINFANEAIEYRLTTASKHFSVGTLSTPIDISGHLKSPSIKPEIGPLAAKAGAAVGLGILFPPAALLPTIQFGTGDNGECKAVEKITSRPTPPQVKAGNGSQAPAVRPGRRR